MMSLAEAARAISARLQGGDARFGGVSTDSRTLAQGDLFVAVRGEHFDGHAFLAGARARGAVAAMVDERFAGAAPLPLLVVDDTRKGLGRLGRHWRERHAPLLIAITGSNGKTTTKEMLASILRAHAGEEATLATRGNLNTDLGVPLTLLGLRAQHRYAAIELGMNHPGEIAYLAALARPLIALVNNAQREHMEFMGSVEAVAEENASVFAALPADGIAVINADDAHAATFRRLAGSRRRVEFSISGRPAAGAPTVKCDFTLGPLATGVRLQLPDGEAHATLAIPGVHNVSNALAAAACAHAAGVAPAAIAAGLEAFRPYSGRLQVKRLPAGATLIDDSYNANPDSVRAAIDVLAAQPAPAVLVLGAMGEVGAHGPEYHAEVGRYARERGLAGLITLGEATREAVAAFGAGARQCTSVEEAVAAAQERAVPGATLLVKGSRFMRMERVSAALTGQNAEAH